MKIFYIFLLIQFNLVLLSCDNTNEPDTSNLNLITETGESRYNDFIGTIDLNDWDPRSYQHLTIKKDFWINKAITDTITVSIAPYVYIRIHNLSESNFFVKSSTTSPFICSTDSLLLMAGQSIDLYLNIDSTLIGQNTIIFGTILFNISNSEPIQFTLRWTRPTDAIESDINPIELGDCLLPAYPNPTFNRVIISFNVKSDQNGILYVLDNNNKIVDTLLNQLLVKGFHSYNWLETQDEKDKVSTGVYKVVFKTDSYSKTGDVLVNK